MARYRLPIHSGKVEAARTFPDFLGHPHIRQRTERYGIRQGIGFPRLKISKSTPPVAPLSKNFARFPEEIPAFRSALKINFEILLTPFSTSPIVFPMNSKDGFTGSLQIGDKLFPESIELGLGDVVTAENINELTRIFTTESILTAVADSIATATTVTVNVTDIDAAIRFIRSRFDDVDYDPFPDRITIFGDDPSIPIPDDGEGDEGHFVLNLVFPVGSQSNPYAE